MFVSRFWSTWTLPTFRGQLLVLIRHHVATEGKLVHLRLLPAQIKDPDLGIWRKKKGNNYDHVDASSIRKLISVSHFGSTGDTEDYRPFWIRGLKSKYISTINHVNNTVTELNGKY